MANLKQNFLINKTFRLNFSVRLSFNIISKIYIMFSMPKNLSMFALFYLHYKVTSPSLRFPNFKSLFGRNIVII